MHCASAALTAEQLLLCSQQEAIATNERARRSGTLCWVSPRSSMAAVKNLIVVTARVLAYAHHLRRLSRLSTLHREPLARYSPLYPSSASVAWAWSAASLAQAATLAALLPRCL